MIKSPLRYPGGKSRLIKTMKDKIPQQMEEYREPFVGGGSFFIYIRQVYSDLPIWINDLNPNLYAFYIEAQQNMENLVKEIKQAKNDYKGKQLYQNINQYGKAARFFILNRITFSGSTESGGYSEQAYKTRFTDSSIDRLYQLSSILNNVRITNESYEILLKAPGKNVFIYLDPPYKAAEKSKLYGKNGNLHKGFDHIKLSKHLSNCNHKWLMTYDNTEEIKQLYQKETIETYTMSYGMSKTPKGKEIFISNY